MVNADVQQCPYTLERPTHEPNMRMKVLQQVYKFCPPKIMIPRCYDAYHLRPITLCKHVSINFVSKATGELTISSVQTRLIHTLSLPGTPSTSCSSTPSHQHLRAGFLQKRSNFCAMPTACPPAKSPLMSVLRRARARLQMTALLGSPARWPHLSS